MHPNDGVVIAGPTVCEDSATGWVYGVGSSPGMQHGGRTEAPTWREAIAAMENSCQQFANFLEYEKVRLVQLEAMCKKGCVELAHVRRHLAAGHMTLDDPVTFNPCAVHDGDDRCGKIVTAEEILHQMSAAAGGVRLTPKQGEVVQKAEAAE
jgi:hypothetical protein